MEFKDYIRKRIRMTKGCSIDCEECLLSYYNNKRGVSCTELERYYPEEADKIMDNWVKDNPLKTNQDVLLDVIRKMFPDIDDIMNGRLKEQNIDPLFCYLINCDGTDCDECPIKQYRDKPYKESEYQICKRE